MDDIRRSIMKKKMVMVVCICICSFASFVGCSENENSSVGEKKMQIESDDVFAGLNVEFEGWNEQGMVSIDTSACDEVIQKNIEFTYDTELDGTLQNGDIVTVYAEPKTDSLKIVDAEYDYTVKGLWTLETVEPFNDGIAWLTYSEDDSTSKNIAAMDTTGKILFHTENTFLDHTEYKDGYALVRFEDGTTVGRVDNKGNIQKIIEGNEIVFLCSEYFVDQEHISDFDNDYYKYTIYDHEGNIVYIGKYDNEKTCQYLGKNVLGFGLSSIFAKQAYGDLYFAENNKRIIDTPVTTSGQEFPIDKLFDEGIALIETDTEDGLRFLDAKGNLSERSIGVDTNLGAWWVYGNYHDGTAVLYNFLGNPSRIGYYDFKKDKFIEGTDALGETLEKLEYKNSILYFSNGIILLALRGEDGERYVAAYDKDWKKVLEPTRGEEFEYTENGFWIKDSSDTYHYYDTEGKELFVSDVCLEYSEGMAFDGKDWVDLDNRVIISEIEVSDTTINVLEENDEKEKFDIEGEYVGNDNTYIEINSDEKMKYTEDGKEYKSKLKKAGEGIWDAEIQFDHGMVSVTMQMDTSGNLFVDGEEGWIAEYYKREK